MIVEQIIKKHLKEKGFDGLAQKNGECGCETCHLIPCDSNFALCEPGYKIADKTGQFDFLIITKKPKL